MLSLEAGDLAPEPDQPISLLHRPAEREGKLRDGIFDEIGWRRCGYRWVGHGLKSSRFAWRAVLVLRSASLGGLSITSRGAPSQAERDRSEGAFDRRRGPRACARLEA